MPRARTTGERRIVHYESRFLPNLHFDLGEIQLSEVTTTLQKLEQAHRTRIAWMGPYSLDGNHLSIHALDLLSVLSHCDRTVENEMELFRLRRSAADQITAVMKRARDEIKIHNLEMWLDSYDKLWLGAEAHKELTQAPQQPSLIELIP